MENDENKCPVCGNELETMPWHYGQGSLEICSVCGIQFGYDDAAGGDESARKWIYHGWRLKWKLDNKLSNKNRSTS